MINFTILFTTVARISTANLRQLFQHEIDDFVVTVTKKICSCFSLAQALAGLAHSNTVIITAFVHS